MDFLLCSITLLLLSLPKGIESQDIKSARLLDLVIRDYLFKSHPKKHFKTGRLYNVNLPSNLSGIDVDTARFRCGSLKRYGANMKEFHLSPGTHAQPCSGERVILVRQNLGSNWSSLYNDNYELTGYTLVSPVLGLLAYDVGCHNRSVSPEVEIRAGKSPITVDFNNATLIETTPGMIALCAGFDENGKMTLTRQARPNVCVATRHGHYGLVVESPLMPMRKLKANRMRIAMGSSIGAALGVFLLSLLGVAMCVNAKKKKARMEEMERRAYEEEALQVSMVGHVRAVTASGTRTMPIIEHFESRNQPRSYF